MLETELEDRLFLPFFLPVLERARFLAPLRPSHADDEKL